MALLITNTQGLMVLKCSFEEKDRAKKIGFKWSAPTKSWVASFSLQKVEEVLKEFPSCGINSDLEDLIEKQLILDENIKQIKIDAAENIDTRFKVAGIKVALHNYQKLGVKFAINSTGGILIADEMGLGKTIQSIATAIYRKKKGEIDKCLIITPASLKWNWPLEIEKFTDESYSVIAGTPEKREKQWTEDVFFYIVNYELITEDLFGGKKIKEKNSETPVQREKRVERENKKKQRVKRMLPVTSRVWDMIILDEIHAIKTHRSMRTQNVKKIKSKYRIGLSGTPVDGKLEELHSIYDFLRPGLFPSKTLFMQKHAETDFFGAIKGYRDVKTVCDKIDPYMIRRLKRNVLKDLPDKIYFDRVIELSDAESKIYKKLAERKHELTEEVEPMVAAIRCKQFCDSPALIEINKVKSSKLTAFIEILTEVILLNGNKAVIFTQYKEMAKLLMLEIEKLGLKYLSITGDTDTKVRADMQEEFNKDNTIDIMIGTDAMSTGLNFTSANYVINYDDNWSPSIMAQREDRCHRIGQKDTVTVINFIVKDTIEERIKSTLMSKMKLSNSALGDDDFIVLQKMSPKEILELL